MTERLKKILENDEHDLLKVTHHPKLATFEDRLSEKFLEISDFYVEHGRIPMVDTADINERKLGVRLRALLLNDEKVRALKHLDEHGLLQVAEPPETLAEIYSGDQFGLLDDPTGILTIRNVPARILKPDEIARARKSKDFSKYEPGFKDVHARLKSGELLRTRIAEQDQIQAGRYFVFNGILAYVQDRNEDFAANGKKNARLRVVFENGTESNILLRSFARTLYRAKEGARIVPAGWQASPEWREETDADRVGGQIYVLQSLSQDPHIQDIRDLHKVGFTTGNVETRIRSAHLDPTYLMAPVDVVAVYKCLNMDAHKLENLLHRFFEEVKLSLSISLPDGTKYVPSEWYVVPLGVLDRVINLIITGEIKYYKYDSGFRDIVLVDELE